MFLKAYFALKRIRLIYCEVRLSDNYTKILSLVINTIPKRKKSLGRSGIRLSQHRNRRFKRASNLLYINLPKLKKNFHAKLLPFNKQKIPISFYTKPRSKTWINFLQTLSSTREQNKTRTLTYNISNLTSQQNLSLQIAQIKKEIALLNRFFYIVQKKHAITKETLNFYHKNLIYLQQKLLKCTSSFKDSEKFINPVMFQQYHTWLLHKRVFNWNKTLYLLKANINKRTRLYKYSNFEGRTKLLMNQLLSVSRNLSKTYGSTYKTNVKFFVNKKIINKNKLAFTVTQNKPNFKIIRTRRRNKSPFSFRFFRQYRQLAKTYKNLQQSSTASHDHKKLILYKIKKSRYKTKWTKKKKPYLNNWKMRQSFRHNYKSHLKLLIKYQYKLCIQDILTKFFKTKFTIKLVQPLSQFNNLKFFRLVYPLHRKPISIPEYKMNFLHLRNKKSHKRYIYIGKRSDTITRYSFKKRANYFIKLRQEALVEYTKKRLFSVKRNLLMRTFTPILSLFIKYLNPQLLADHIAKEFERTKRQRRVLFALSTALRAIHFSRAIGYRIAIVGRINSADKSRSYYLTKKAVSRQNYANKVNFATAHARARIGSFGIKVWIFY